jgi:hypothetical protein
MRWFSWLLAGCLATGTGCLMAASSVAGEPAIAGYADFAALQAQLQELDQSNLVRLTSLGKTMGGRDIWLATLGQGEIDQKPAFLIVGGVEPAHLAGSELAMRTARLLVEKHATDEKTRSLLERYTLYVIPRPAPDACEAFFEKPFAERAGNLRPTDDDRDGTPDEDPPEDLNGDGAITQMRVLDERGPYLLHPADGRILIKADPNKNEIGRYALYVEGRDNDGDELLNEDPPGGVAFNRNFTFNYNFDRLHAGPHQVSENETRAVADFAYDHVQIAAVLSFTPEDNLMTPWKPDGNRDGQRIKTVIRSADAPLADFVAEKYRQMLGGKDPPPPPAGEGSFSEWAYFHYGRWSFAMRGWWVPKVPLAEGEKEPADKRGADELHQLRWLAQQNIAGFADWQPLDHPDFPGKKVEIGGFRPYVLLNPPAAELDALAEKHARFVLELADLLPRLSIAETKLESLGGGLFRLSASLRNEGYLPTMTEMGRTNGQPYPLQITLALPPTMKLVTGSPRSRIDKLDGAGGRAERVWLLQRGSDQPASVTISVRGPSVGAATATVEVK